MPTPQQPRPPSGSPPPPGRGQLSWKAWIALLALLAAMTAGQFFAAKEEKNDGIDYTEFYSLVDAGKVATATMKGPNVEGTFHGKQTVDGRSLTTFHTMLPPLDDRDLLPLLRTKDVQLTVKSEEQPWLLRALISVLPWVLILGGWLWLSRRASAAMAGGGGPFAGMLRNKSHRFEKESQVSVRFDDVAGLAGAKRDLMEIVQFLKEPEAFRRLGGKVPRGVLLVGPPGTGKTLLARAVAGEAGVPFFSISGSEFIELFVGMGASRVRSLFEEAKKATPSIIFIDEIDAVGRSRGTGLGGGNDEREQTLNQLLSEMDGFARSDLTIVMAATNRPDVLDTALLRPGRFDRRIVVDRPELAARRAILGVHTRGKPLGPDVDLDAIAANTPGFSGADLENLANEAALGATRRKVDAIQAQDFSAAYDKIVLGDPRDTKLDAIEKRRVAVHESGHAVVAYFAPHAEALERVTIIPRGMALGVTQQTPSANRHISTQAELEARLSVLMGGYAAERVVLGDISSGAESDLRTATQTAFDMVAHYGMSERVGPVFHDHRTENPFLGRTIATEGATSDATVHAIEEETRRILSHSVQLARHIIAEHRDALDRLVTRLLEQETIEKVDLVGILGPAPASPPASRPADHRSP